MFCPKCGTKNPDNGKFCRGCGTDLGTVSEALTGKLAVKQNRQLKNHKGKSISWESAFGKLFTGIAFVAVTVALANSVVGTGWWFWMLIPALAMVGAGLAQIIQLKSAEKSNHLVIPNEEEKELAVGKQAILPPTQTEYVAPETRYKTGDLVPPSITEPTTRHLEINSEGETMTLPKNKI